MQNKSRRQFTIRINSYMSGKQRDLFMHFTVSTGFIQYFDSLTNELESYKIGQHMNRSYQFHYKHLILFQNY